MYCYYTATLALKARYCKEVLFSFVEGNVKTKCLTLDPSTSFFPQVLMKIEESKSGFRLQLLYYARSVAKRCDWNQAPGCQRKTLSRQAILVFVAGVVPCGGPKKSPRTSSIVQIIFFF